MKYKLQCNWCGERFVHIGDGFPDECPLCHAYVGDNGKPEVALPAISLKANRSPDMLNRAMEEGAKHRAYQAAEMTGQPVSDFSHLQHTNMRDNVREGDTTFVPHKLPADMTASFGAPGQPTGVDPAVIANVRAEQDPRARGVGQMANVNKFHRENVGQMVRAGQQGKY